MYTIDLSGTWAFGMTERLDDSINLPTTTSYAKKGKENRAYETYFLTDLYPYEGIAWYEKEIVLNEEILEKLEEMDGFLLLERTRKTKVWMNDSYVGEQDSLTTPHQYKITDFIPENGNLRIRIAVENTKYKTKGGHMTSQDTQTNWNGITGCVELFFVHKNRIEDVKITSLSEKNSFLVEGIWTGKNPITAQVVAKGTDQSHSLPAYKVELIPGKNSFFYPCGENLRKWSEFDPYLYDVDIEILGGESTTIRTGFREFSATRDRFLINGFPTFLRGKHDGLIFPDTGYAPTEVAEWRRILQIAKNYGMNHYRFHTCCPPEAAFTAADELGMYMQPELPFWGTITGPEDENHDALQLEYLIEEGFRILKTFGNHPSFVMMSLGNELWGNKEVLNSILANYKKMDARHLYTQGSNNFQFVPNVLEEDDFFSGVRFSKERLIRGSYAMCDAPLGHVQTDKPSTKKDYDSCFDTGAGQGVERILGAEKELEIQFGTTTKKVELDEVKAEFVPKVPVVTHEIGQYETYPDFREIERYQGPLRARNFEVFQQRLKEKGLADLAQEYFWCSGQLAMACYQEEIEAALRSKKIAGFQLLDLQDFSGQGTALVGVLNAFMESKGLIPEEKWRSFCFNQVLLARFESYTMEEETFFEALLQLSSYKPIKAAKYKLVYELRDSKGKKNDFESAGELDVFLDGSGGVFDLGKISIQLPKVNQVEEFRFRMRMEELQVEKEYTLYVVPRVEKRELEEVHFTQEKTRVYYQWENLVEGISREERILYFPPLEELQACSIEGTYCTDFWCYPMFRSISESVKRPIPVGTMGLLVQQEHPLMKNLATRKWSTPQWWSIVEASRMMILDESCPSLRPVVQSIDNFERNHKLGLLWEVKIGATKVLICSCDHRKLSESFEGRYFLKELYHYLDSSQFQPNEMLSMDDLKKIFKYS